MHEHPERFGSATPAADAPLLTTSPEDFTRWIGELTGRLRLPSEAEWEYVARAGSTARYWWGDAFEDAQCWHAGNARGPMSVELHARAPNAFGLIDTLGNCYELTADSNPDWRRRLPPEAHDYRAGPDDHLPRRPRGLVANVLRGGDVWSHAPRLRAAHRRFYAVGAILLFGVRLVQGLHAEREPPQDSYSST